MEILLVRVHVKVEAIEAFREATIENARCSLKEPGIARFDVAQQEDDPARFVLVEAYRSREANAAHRLAPHYLAWRAAVESMMVEPRVGTWHTVIHPGDEGFR